tara:strand:- start:2751 stop:3140 length:390 start_codon:yes stop_codon:yes gene_type:complete
LVYSIGTDLLEKTRVEKILRRFKTKFISKVLTTKEIDFYDSLDCSKRKVDFLSNNFAAKEAVSKVLGTGFSLGVTLKSIEIIRNLNGSPLVVLKNEAKNIAKSKGIKEILISISDTKEQSMAFALGVKK